jgi:hypothetical protein
MSNRQTLPVIELFRGQTRLELLDAALTELDRDEWYRTGEIVERISTSNESFRKHVKPLLAFDVFTVRDPDARIPHYQVSNSAVVQLLTKYHNSDQPDLIELLNNSPTRHLVEFFLTRADPEASYSRNKLQQITEAGFHGIKNNIGRLVEAGMLTEVEGTRGTEYQIDESSPVVRFMRELNEALYEAYQQN